MITTTTKWNSLYFCLFEFNGYARKVIKFNQIGPMSVASNGKYFFTYFCAYRDNETNKFSYQISFQNRIVLLELLFSTLTISASIDMHTRFSEECWWISKCQTSRFFWRRESRGLQTQDFYSKSFCEIKPFFFFI